MPAFKTIFLLPMLLAVSLTTYSQKFYKTPSGEKYHRGDCRMVENVSEEISTTVIAKLKLEPCKICKPQAVDVGSPGNTAQGRKPTGQCRGTTKAGSRCKHMTSLANGYCYQHNPDK